MDQSNQLMPIDMEHLKIFTGGNKNEEDELFSIFLEQSRLTMAELEHGYISQNDDIWRKASHRMKGSSANLGAKQLAVACENAEINFEAGRAVKKVLIAVIRKEMKYLQLFLERKVI